MLRDLAIDWSCRAQVNETLFQFGGEGYGDVADGSCELHLEASPGFPEGFDPVSCPCICSHPTSSFFSRAQGSAGWHAITGGEYFVSPARVGVVYDHRGAELLRLSVTSHMRLEGDRLIARNVMEGFSHLPPLARILTPFDDFIVPSGSCSATGIVRFKLETKDGRLLDGVCSIPYAWKGKTLAAPLQRTVHVMRVDWDGGPRVSAHYRTSLTELVVPQSRDLRVERGALASLIA